MNTRYYQLPIDKQKKLMNSGYKLFALYPYKKASMAAIADEANISKSLLFYYFKNKEEYYLFLFDKAVQFVNEQKSDNVEEKKYDLFDMVNLTIERRIKMINDYPYLYKFIARAYYEEIEGIKIEIDKKKKNMMQIGNEEILSIIDYSKFKNSNDVDVLLNMILCIAEGCMRGHEDLNIEKMQDTIKTFKNMMESLKSHYYKEEYLVK